MARPAPFFFASPNHQHRDLAVVNGKPSPNNKMIQVIRETQEAPESVHERLRLAGGTNRFGEPMYRVVWGWSRLTWMGGKWTDRDESGNFVREVVQLRETPKYPQLNRWHVEKWCPPEMYGSPRLWWAQTVQRENGEFIPALGPYPSRGEYEHSFVIEGPKGEFVQLTPTIVEQVARRIEFSRNYSLAQRRVAALAQHEREDKAYLDWAVDAMESPAFSGMPFVAVG